MEGWNLLGRFPDVEDGVGSWMLTHNRESMLVEVPPGLSVREIAPHFRSTNVKYAIASHDHEDHLDVPTWRRLMKYYPEVLFYKNWQPYREYVYSLGGEPVWILPAPKHSMTDIVIVFRGIAMTGDIELGQLESVNDEVPDARKRTSMAWLRDFPKRHDYHIHTIMSAHLNDTRYNVDWESLFNVG